MVRNNPPSLRNFAVLKLERRNTLGRVYSVRDRRLEAANQYLFVPSKRRAWPRYLAQFSNLGTTPVRLRDGKVALLIAPSVDLASVKFALKPAKQTRLTFDAISGFHHDTVKRRRSLLIATTCSGLICLSLLPHAFATPEVRTKPVAIEVETRRLTCSTTPKAGEQVQLQTDRQTELNGIKYLVQAKTQLGGLVQLNLVRVCDESKWKVTAWKTGKVYQIASIG
ncbi:MAG: hypothetical protein RJA78_457 [Actinomycetota bacterium]